MIDIEHQPLKKIIVHHIVRYQTIEKFLQNAIGPNTTTLGWCGGLLFNVGRFGHSDRIVNDSLDGIDHIAGIYYCAMPEYKATIRNNQNFEIMLIDQSNEEQAAALADYLIKLDTK